jgi:hypothetical protein
MWVRDRQILTTALGNSTTTVPAITGMHYRIGGIAETFMSMLLLMLVEHGRMGLDDRISRGFPQLLAADPVTVRMLVGDTAGYIDYVTVDDFLKLEMTQPFRTFTDDELINRSVRNGKMNFSPRHKPAILPHGQRHPGPGHPAQHQAVHEDGVRQEYLRANGYKRHAVSGRLANPKPGAPRIHDGSQDLRGLHLLESILGFDAGVPAPRPPVVTSVGAAPVIAILCTYLA